MRAPWPKRRHAPLLGGFLVLFGALLAFAGQWAILTGRLPHAEGAALRRAAG